MSKIKKKIPKRVPSGNVPRDPPDSVKRELRQQVHYACPIPGCGKACLEYHHFDPPWEEKHHQNPNGMIAICTECHPRADAGVWSREQLHSYKNTPVPEGLIRSAFGWAERSVVYRLGNCYAANNSAVLAVNDRPVLWETRSPEGRLLFSLDFYDHRTKRMLQIFENSLSVDLANVHDLELNTSATRLRLWIGKRKLGIDLRFRRMTIQQMAELMEGDARKAQIFAQKLLEEPSISENEDAVEPVAATRIQRRLAYVTEHCLDSDGGITLVDIARARLYGPNGCHGEISEKGVITGPASGFFSCHAFGNHGFGFSI